jgi:ribonuclease P/MRP protein subunit RPP1
MNFYDLHITSEFSEGESSIEDIVRRAKLLGFKGICFAEHFKNLNRIKNLRKTVSEISEKFDLDIFIGFEAKGSEELKKLVKIRKDYDILLVRGSDLYLNRKAVQTKEVDILTHPELKRKDSGFNHIMAKLAARNDVAIEINFREILQSSKGTRSHVIQNIAKNIKLCKKFKAPMIICSGAVSHWQLKDPKILMSMGFMLGLELNESKKALSEVPESIIRMIKERKSKEWVRPGVKIVK